MPLQPSDSLVWKRFAQLGISVRRRVVQAVNTNLLVVARAGRNRAFTAFRKLPHAADHKGLLKS